MGPGALMGTSRGEDTGFTIMVAGPDTEQGLVPPAPWPPPWEHPSPPSPAHLAGLGVDWAVGGPGLAHRRH